MESIANFTVQYKYTLEAKSKILRGIEFTNNHGAKKVIELSAREFTDMKSFCERIAEAGEFYFYGKGDDFKNLIKEIISQEHQQIEVVDKLGKYKPGIFVTSNQFYFRGLKQDKKEGIFEVGKQFYKHSDALDNMPVITTDKLDTYPETLRALINAQISSLNGNLDGLIALSYLRASLHATELISHYGFFPFLLVVGEKGSGKNFFCKILLKVMGMESNGDGIPSSTQVGILRKATMMQDLPYWLDEYSDNYHSGKKIEGLLRSAFNRSPFVKADLNSDTEIKTTICTSTFILSGESMSSDIATRERFVNITLSRDKQNVEGKNKLMDIENNLNVIGSYWINQMCKDYRKYDDMFKTIDRDIAFLTQSYPRKDSRILAIYGTILYFMRTIFNDIGGIPQLSPEEVVMGYLEEDAESKEGSTHVIKFWEDFITLTKNGQITNGKHYYYGGESRLLYIHWPSIKSEILQLRRKQGIDQRIEEDTLKNYLFQSYRSTQVTASPYVEGVSMKQFRALGFKIDVLPSFVQEEFI